MGFQDRPYYHEGQQYGPNRPGGMAGSGMPRMTPAVKYLLIINVAVFIMQSFGNGAIEGVFAATTAEPFQIWRLITFQFLHADPIHLLCNMIGLFFLGRILEMNWGTKKFLRFYLVCGAVGGALYLVFSHLDLLAPGILIGASGGVLGLLVACAVLFPQIRVILILFPMPIRTAALLLAAAYAMFVLSRGSNAGGHLCHLGGMATGFIWVMARPYLNARRQKANRFTQQRGAQDQAKRGRRFPLSIASVYLYEADSGFGWRFLGHRQSLCGAGTQHPNPCQQDKVGVQKSPARFWTGDKAIVSYVLIPFLEGFRKSAKAGSLAFSLPCSGRRDYSCGTAPDSHRSSPFMSLASGPLGHHFREVI